jgi:hypothetical protein
MNNIPLNVKKYLDKYGFNKWQIEPNQKITYNAVIVIPAICELDNILTLLNSLADNHDEYFKSALVLFVINNNQDSSKEIKTNNNKTIELLKNIINKKNNDELIRKIIFSGLQIAFVDASTEGKELPAKDAGVGLARKIGMDIALTILDYDSPFKKILICLDADCTIENNYMSEIINNFNNKNVKSAVIKFSHLLNNKGKETEAIICYEIFLRYYTAGLKYADSPYAFHTVGSTIACDYESYIKVEGMNKRKAAEDFYFLEKLIKNSSVEEINSTEVHPSGRKSWRVPFGTGQRITRFLSKGQNEYLLYNPKSFEILKRWLEVFNNENYIYAEDYLNASKEISIELYQFLIYQNFKSTWDKIVKNSPDEDQIIIQKLRWFDGFKTLKLIHYLRDTSYPQVNMFEALDALFDKLSLPIPQRNGKIIPPAEIQADYLEILRNFE